jgi:hypothetical protein
MSEKKVSGAILFDHREVEHLGTLSERPKRLSVPGSCGSDIDRQHRMLR